MPLERPSALSLSSSASLSPVGTSPVHIMTRSRGSRASLLRPMATRTRLSAAGAPEYLATAGPALQPDNYQLARLHSALQAAGISPLSLDGRGLG